MSMLERPRVAMTSAWDGPMAVATSVCSPVPLLVEFSIAKEGAEPKLCCSNLRVVLLACAPSSRAGKSGETGHAELCAACEDEPFTVPEYSISCSTEPRDVDTSASPL